jgi:hypothetical protein
MAVNDELGRLRKEAVEAHFKQLSPRLQEGTEGSHENSVRADSVRTENQTGSS